MRDFVIMTDSCCDLTDEMARELGIVVVPLSLEMGGQTYRNWLDGRDIAFQDFYSRIRAGETATTSAVSVGDFQEQMREILSQGKDILHLSFSSALSTTYQSAVIAADDLREEFPDGQVLVVDSRCASLGQGLLVYLCAREKAAGRSLTGLRDYAEATKGQICHWFTVDDLNHLKRGGRISAATALVGTMLSIKPVLHVDDEGRLISVSKARGRKAQLCGTGDRQPLRPRHRGAVLRGQQALKRRLDMDWLQLHIDTTHAGLEPVETMLSALGIDGVVIDDETEFQDFLENNHQYWDYVDEDLTAQMAGKSRITFYLEAGEEGFAKMGEVRLALEQLKTQRDDCGSLLLTLENLKDADWENNWKQYYKPMEIGEHLVVVPQWLQEDPKVQKLLAEGRVPLILDPGLTFGTGSHATTRLCLTALDQRIHGGERVLDLGCGSGILSIAALRLGAKEAFACDIDDKCQDVAYENAALNGIGADTYTVQVGDILTNEALQTAIGGGYDIVLANIVADVIIALAPAVRPLLAEHGVFLCSGIIDDRAEEVAEKLRAAGLEILETHSAEGWFSYLCR